MGRVVRVVGHVLKLCNDERHGELGDGSGVGGCGG